MKTRCLFLSVLLSLANYAGAQAITFPIDDGIDKNDPSFVGWADGYTNYLFGSNLSEQWKIPVKALGPAVGDSFDITGLGRGGELTLTFSLGIANGSGADFAVFENGISPTFLELAFVEVSSDGEHFVRFPNYSLSPDPIEGFGAVNPVLIYGLASRYQQGIGTPFDLDELIAVSNTIASGTHSFSPDYATNFTANIGLLDFDNIGFVRIVDIVGGDSESGDELSYDSEGYAIYDPYPTSGSAGFDLEAVGVINRSAVNGIEQFIAFDPIPNQRLDFHSLELTATADSGLPVSFSVQSGPAILTNEVLSFTGTGIVEVVATQQGDATYAPASPILHSFQIAEQIQHIFIQQFPNISTGIGFFQVQAWSSSGLPVQMEIFSGPENVTVAPHAPFVVSINNEVGDVVLRAYQPGDNLTAPADDVFMTVSLLDQNAPYHAEPLSVWLISNNVPDVVMNLTNDVYGHPAVDLSYPVDLTLSGRTYLEWSTDLQTWTNAVPEILEQEKSGQTVDMRVRSTVNENQLFYRLRLDGF